MKHYERYKFGSYLLYNGNNLLYTCNLTFSENDLFFVCDVDLLVKFNTLQRIRMHASADQAYFPIFFSQYQKASGLNEITEDDGFWRTFSYGMVAMRKVS